MPKAAIDENKDIRIYESVRRSGDPRIHLMADMPTL
jgi:hypothetical protein